MKGKLDKPSRRQSYDEVKEKVKKQREEKEGKERSAGIGKLAEDKLQADGSSSDEKSKE